MTANICNDSEELADMWHGTVHGPDTLDFSRTSKQDHVLACARMYAHMRSRFGDVAVLLRNSKDQKVRKLESEKRWKNMIWVVPIQRPENGCNESGAQAAGGSAAVRARERRGDQGSVDGTARTGGVGDAGGPAAQAAASRV